MVRTGESVAFERQQAYEAAKVDPRERWLSQLSEAIRRYHAAKAQAETCREREADASPATVHWWWSKRTYWEGVAARRAEQVEALANEGPR